VVLSYPELLSTVSISGWRHCGGEGGGGGKHEEGGGAGQGGGRDPIGGVKEAIVVRSYPELPSTVFILVEEALRWRMWWSWDVW